MKRFVFLISLTSQSDPSTQWHSESTEEVEEVSRLRREIAQLKKDLLAIDHSKAPVVQQSIPDEEKLTHIQEDLDKKLGRKKAPKKLKRKVVEGDSIDELLVQMITEMDIDPQHIKRLSEGVYMVGSKKIHMR